MTISEDVRPEYRFVPILGASADRQILREEDGLRLELLGLGNEVGSLGLSDWRELLTAKLKFTNLTEEEKSAAILGVEINGIYFDTYTYCDIKGGGTWYTTVRLKADDIRAGTDQTPDFETDRRVEETSEVILHIGFDRKLYTYEVQLAQKGEQERVQARGDVLYEDEEVRVVCESCRNIPDSSGEDWVVWELWVENKTGGYRNYSLTQKVPEENGSEWLLRKTVLAPGTKQLHLVWTSPEMAREGLPVYLKSNFGSVKSSEEFVLKIPEGNGEEG